MTVGESSLSQVRTRGRRLFPQLPLTNHDHALDLEENDIYVHPPVGPRYRGWVFGWRGALGLRERLTKKNVRVRGGSPRARPVRLRFDSNLKTRRKPSTHHHIADTDAAEY